MREGNGNVCLESLDQGFCLDLCPLFLSNFCFFFLYTVFFLFGFREKNVKAVLGERILVVKKRKLLECPLWKTLSSKFLLVFFFRKMPLFPLCLPPFVPKIVYYPQKSFLLNFKNVFKIYFEFLWKKRKRENQKGKNGR